MTTTFSADPSVELIQTPPSPGTAGDPRRIVIVPPGGLELINVGQLWHYRELLFFLVWRDVKVRYKQTVLGAAWAVLQPAMMMIVFTIFFGRMAKMPSGGLPYPLFAFAGLLPWTFFSSAVSKAGNSVVASEELITKVYFPRLTIPFASVGASMVDFVCAFGLLIGMMAYYQVGLGWGLLMVPVVVGLITIAAIGIGTMLAALNVVYRDFRYLIPFMIQLGMFATPTIYMQPDAEPRGWLQILLDLNPMTNLIAAFRAAVLGGPFPWVGFLVSLGSVSLISILGCLYFRKVEDSFADII
jgi:lipopolysaccharide transport system permease protein